MDNLEKHEYYDHVEFYLNDSLKPSFNAEIYISEDVSCEGIAVDDNQNSYFIFGSFKKFNEFDLYLVISNQEVYRYRGRKVPFRYEGEYSLINDSKVNSFYAKVSGLDVDPRDYIDEETPKEKFIKKLYAFKENWLSDERNNTLYNSVNSTDNDEKKTHK